jgi:hypothetical protein
MFLLPHGKITSLLYIMKKPKQNIILHANKNIEHSHSNMVIHRIAQSKSYVENIDEHTPQGARCKPSFSLITHIHSKQVRSKRNNRKKLNSSIPVHNQNCTDLFSVVVKDSIEHKHSACDSTHSDHDKLSQQNNLHIAQYDKLFYQNNNLLRKLKKNDNIRQIQFENLIKHIKKHDNDDDSQQNKLLQKLEKQDQLRQKQHVRILNKIKTHDDADNSQQNKLLQNLEKHEHQRQKQHIRLLNKIKKHDNLFDKLLLLNQACKKNSDSQFEELMKQLYEEAGESIETILEAFVNEDDSLPVLLEHENYARLADILHSLKNEDNVLFETFRQLLVDSIEGTKKSDNRQGEQDAEYKKLLALYNTLRAEYEQAPLFQVEADLDTAAEVLPEILEYIRRGNKLVNESGKLIPLDMDLLGEIRTDLGID